MHLFEKKHHGGIKGHSPAGAWIAQMQMSIQRNAFWIAQMQMSIQGHAFCIA